MVEALDVVETLPGGRNITGTYRLQLHADAGFEAASRQVPYLADLGVSHLYLSPILQAGPGSMHGYDVVDHTRISADLGGEAGLVELAEVAHDRGLGLVCDVVPNHMTVPSDTALNQPLWQVLRDGPAAATADWFDIDWDLCDGRIGLPFLGGSLDEVLTRGDLQLEERDGDAVVRYHDQVFPIAPGSDAGSLADVLSRQHYLLADWRDKADVLGYRRFFDVDRLIAIRVDLPEVFDATHAVLIDLHRRGILDGFRIDHPDGLSDPEDYLEQLRKATGGAWVVVEKILQGDERLPASWATAGTTGYDAIKVIQTALAPSTGAALDKLWRSTGGPGSLAETELEAKRLVIDELLRPELLRLVRRATTAAADAGLRLASTDLEGALRELLAHVSVYRAYVRVGHLPAADSLARLDEMCAAATRGRPDLADTVTHLRQLLVDVDTPSAAGRDLILRFQQVCGPVMAKGVEDTTCYRYHRLVALNEVGGDPASLDAPGPRALHAWAQLQLSASPAGLTALSTHDTKRDEDVRARLLAAADDLESWEAVWRLVAAAAKGHYVDAPTAYLLMQTLVGAWPITPDRLAGYLPKAVREAKQYTTWSDPDPAYEQRVLDLGAACLNGDVADFIERWVTQLTPAERSRNLSAKLLQLTMPGVPDVYQGCEGVQRSLVDPDSRRDVDFKGLRARLTRLDADQRPTDLMDEKLRLTSRVLRLRRDRPELFAVESTYLPLPSTSPLVLGFVRSEAVATVVSRGIVPASADSTFSLPAGSWRDLLSDRVVRGATVSCAEALAERGVALFVREDG